MLPFLLLRFLLPVRVLLPVRLLWLVILLGRLVFLRLILSFVLLILLRISKSSCAKEHEQSYRAENYKAFHGVCLTMRLSGG
jgi:hypothetical protein